MEHHLVIAKEDEYDFGWVFFYNDKMYVETGRPEYAIVKGNFHARFLGPGLPLDQLHSAENSEASVSQPRSAEKKIPGRRSGLGLASK